MTYRTRTQGQLVGALDNWSETGQCNTNSGQRTVDTLLSGTTKTMTDVVVPDYHSRSARGEVFVNPLWLNSSQRSYSVGANSRIKYPDYCGAGKDRYFEREIYSQSYGLFLKPQSTLSANLETLAGTQAQAAVMEPDVMALVAIAEAKSTMRDLKQPIDKTFRFYRQVQRSRQFKISGLSLGRFVASNWLKYRYFLTPLALEMQGVIKLATKDVAGRRQTARGYAATTENYADTIIGVNDSSWLQSIDRQCLFKNSVRAGILYDWRFDWNTLTGFSWRELPSVAWELVPYSFVLDWFANTGDFIRAIQPRAGVNVLGSWTTTKWEYDMSNTSTFTWNWTGSPNTKQPVSTPQVSESGVDTVLHRKPGIRVGLAHKMETISFDRPTDWIHYADAMALLKQKYAS